MSLDKPEKSELRQETSAALIDEYITCQWRAERQKTHPYENLPEKEKEYCRQIEATAKKVLKDPQIHPRDLVIVPAFPESESR